MSLTVKCQQCDGLLQVKSEYAGRDVKCPRCGQIVHVPSNETTAIAERPVVEVKVSADGQGVPGNTLVAKHREEYSNALSVIDNEVSVLIQIGKEMKALVLYQEQIKRISEVHESLTVLYSFVFHMKPVLEHFGSERLRQLGHSPVPTRECLKNAHLGEDDVEKYVLQQFRNVGFQAVDHFFLKSVFLTEIEYMLDALEILVEPEFVPCQNDAEVESSDRYIPAAVKLNVWRRDLGKCVQCGSKERLEYDHIIPLSRGGSNTERNIQLLCEKCNRLKAAQIA